MVECATGSRKLTALVLLLRSIGLICRGHRTIALLSSDGPHREENVAEVRAAGYAEAMRDLGLESQIRICRAPRYSPTVPAAVLELLAAESRPTAVFAVSDGYAVHLYNAAGELGIAIPGDLAIAGYDEGVLEQKFRGMLRALSLGAPPQISTASLADRTAHYIAANWSRLRS